jgi:hypothetical protein
MLLLLSSVASRQLTVIRVADRGDLQAALNAAKPGDQVLLAAGGHYTGSFVLPAQPASSQAFITVRTESDDLPPADVRITPDASGTLALIQSASSDPAVRTAAGAHHWRFENVEFGPTRTGTSAIIELGDAHQTASDVPHDLIFDRVYIHGDPEQGQRRGIAVNSASTQIRNSYISEIKGIGVDTQAIGGWNGPGPFTIENNYLEAAGEVIMFGGGDPSIDHLVPRNIVIRGNHLTRPVAWRSERWTVKNLFELKNAADVTVEGNLFETHWAGGQPGYAIVMTPRNQDGGADWSTVTGVRFINNIVRHVSAGVNISGSDDRHPSGTARDITIANNLFADVDGKAWGGPGDFLQIGRGAADVKIEHNTVQQTGRIVWAYGKDGFPGFVFRGNIVRHNAYGVMGDNASPGKVTFERYLPDAIFEKNVIAGGQASRYPGNNQFIPEDGFDALFDDLAGGNFHVRSPGAGANPELLARALRAR